MKNQNRSSEMSKSSEDLEALMQELRFLEINLFFKSARGNGAYSELKMQKGKYRLVKIVTEAQYRAGFLADIIRRMRDDILSYEKARN